MMKSKIETLLTIEEVAAILQLPRETAYKYARNQTIPAFKVGRHWRFEPNDIQKFMSAQKKEAAAQKKEAAAPSVV